MKILAQVELTAVSGMAEDSVINTFAINTAADWNPATELGEITTQLAAFYNGATAPDLAIEPFMSTALSRASQGIKMKLYEVTDLSGAANMGSPFATDTGTLSNTATGVNLPSEVACVLTLRGQGWEGSAVEAADGGDAGSAPDRPRQRKTGRVFVGPLNTSALEPATPNLEARPRANFREALLDAGQRLGDGLAVNGHHWCVWSRKNSAFYTVTDIQIDNAFDTQRRRGQGPTSRQTRAI